jgi:hypothetical protein
VPQTCTWAGAGAGGDAAGCVRERLPGFDLVVAVAVPVGGDPGGGEHGQGGVVGGGPGEFGQRGGGGGGPNGADQDAAGGGERQVPGRDGLTGAGATITYAKLPCEVCQAANALTEPPTCMRCTGRAGLGDLASRWGIDRLGS